MSSEYGHLFFHPFNMTFLMIDSSRYKQIIIYTINLLKSTVFVTFCVCASFIPFPGTYSAEEDTLIYRKRNCTCRLRFVWLDGNKVRQEQMRNYEKKLMVQGRMKREKVRKMRVQDEYFCYKSLSENTSIEGIPFATNLIYFNQYIAVEMDTTKTTDNYSPLAFLLI